MVGVKVAAKNNIFVHITHEASHTCTGMYMYIHVQVCTHERQDELMTLGRVIFCVLLAQAVGLTY